LNILLGITKVLNKKQYEKDFNRRFWKIYFLFNKYQRFKQGACQNLKANHKNAKAIVLNVLDTPSRTKTFKKADIVIPMLPARFHV